MNTTSAIVIDKNGYYVDLVALDNEGVPVFFEMQDGFEIVTEDIAAALNLFKPRWNGETWEETGEPPEVTPEERLAREIAKLNAKIHDIPTLALVVAQIYDAVNGTHDGEGLAVMRETAASEATGETEIPRSEWREWVDKRDRLMAEAEKETE